MKYDATFQDTFLESIATCRTQFADIVVKTAECNHTEDIGILIAGFVVQQLLVSSSTCLYL